MNLTRSLAAVAVASSLVLAGCGDKDKDDDASKAGDPGSGNTVPDVDAGDTVEVEDFVALVAAGVEEMTTAQMTMETSGGPVANLNMDYDGEIDYRTEPPSIALTMTSSGVEMEIRFVDGTFYMNLGQMSGGKFYTATAEELAAGSGLEAAEGSDPAAVFEAMQDGIQEVVYIGEESVDGEDAAHYEVTLDTAKLDQFENAPGVPDTLTWDYWLDDEGRMVKTEAVVMGMTTTTTLGDFGEDVDIEKPAASEIAGDFGDMMGAGS